VEAGRGVRSIGELYTHIVAANYGVAESLGTQPPAGFDFKSITAMSTDKAKTVEALSAFPAGYSGAQRRGRR
jgi:hypothetical protein